MNKNCDIKTIYITTDDFSVFDTTEKLTEKDIELLKNELVDNMNKALNCTEDC